MDVQNGSFEVGKQAQEFIGRKPVGRIGRPAIGNRLAGEGLVKQQTSWSECRSDGGGEAPLEEMTDQDQIEAEMGNLLEEEEPFILPDKKGGTGKLKRPAPTKDDKLYDL